MNIVKQMMGKTFKNEFINKALIIFVIILVIYVSSTYLSDN